MNVLELGKPYVLFCLSFKAFNVHFWYCKAIKQYHLAYSVWSNTVVLTQILLRKNNLSLEWQFAWLRTEQSILNLTSIAWCKCWTTDLIANLLVLLAFSWAQDLLLLCVICGCSDCFLLCFSLPANILQLLFLLPVDVHGTWYVELEPQPRFN